MAKEQMKDLTAKLAGENAKAEQAKSAAEKQRQHVDEVIAATDAAMRDLDDDLVSGIEASKTAAIEAAKSDIANEKKNQQEAARAAEGVKGQIESKNASNRKSLGELSKLQSNIYGAKVEGAKKAIEGSIAEGTSASKTSDTTMQNTGSAIDNASAGL